MAYTELPTINFDSNPGLDEFKYLHSVYSEEFKLRSSIATSYGIVDRSLDPAAAPYTTGRSLLVTISPVNPVTIDIASGIAITPSNLLINIDAAVPSVPLPNISTGKTYVVAVEYLLVPSSNNRVDRFGVLTEVRLQRPSNTPPGGDASTLLNAITIVDINDYNDITIFTPERLQNIVVIAIVSVLTDPTTTSLYLSIDLTNTNYTFNRPWFSTVDTSHRSLIGSGLVTVNNPHGTELQDLSSAGLTLYQQQLSRGLVIAKDFSYYGYPGRICTESISLNRFVVDSTGELVPPSPNQPPMAGRWYFTLTKLPVRPGSLYLLGQPWKPIPYEWIPGTRYIVLGALEQPSLYPSDLVMEYFSVDALEVNAESPTQGIQTIELKQPVSTEEFIVSSGLALSELTQTTISLVSTLGPIKKNYEVLCDGTGSLVLSPQPLVSTISVPDLIGTPQTINQSPFGGEAVYLIVGLHNATKRTAIGSNSFDLNLKLTLTGQDNDGATLQESLVFKASQWEDQDPTLDVEQPLQTIRTLNKFSLITQIAIGNTTTEPPYAGNDAVLTLWADCLSAKINQDLAKSASFFWTGTKGIHVRDERLISTTIQVKDQKQNRLPLEMPEGSIPAIPELFSTLLNPPIITKPITRLMMELDDDRIYGESWEEFSTSYAGASITLNQLGELTPHLTLRISEQKYLKIVLSGAVPANGEVNWADTSLSPTIFLNNLIATINNPTFESLWFATLGTTGTNPPISLSRQRAYPEGFLLNVRKKVVFDALWLAGDVTVTINGTSFLVSSLGDSDAAIALMISDINASGLGIEAVLPVTQSTSQPYFLLNGLPEGQTFDAYVVADTGSGAPNAYILTPTDPFTFSQPSGGILPTPHLPQRYPSKPWTYLTRPFLWSGVFLEAKISISDNDNVASNDIIEIALGKPLTAKKSPSLANPSKGEFQVGTTDIETLQNMAGTVNDSLFASGVLGIAEENSPILGESVGTGDAGTLIFTKTLNQIPIENSIEISVSGIVVAVDDGLGGISGTGISGAINYLTRVMSLTFALAPDRNAPIIVDYLSNVLKLRMAGTGNSSLRQISQSTTGTWALQSYTPTGSHKANAFMKTLYPLARAEWRFQTVEDISLGWSLWMPMGFISPTAFKFQAPPQKSLYEIQIRLEGADNRPNAFSLYEIEPETSGADVGSLDVRLTAVETEIETARGSTLSLDDRLSGTINPDGTPIPNAEVLASYNSAVMPSFSSLKRRLDTVDSLILLASGGVDNLSTPVLMAQKGASSIVSGPVDGNGNSNFMSAGSGGDQGKVIIGGGDGITTPSLVIWLEGFSYVYKRNWYLSFIGQTSGTYFIYMERGSNAYGLQIMSSTGTMTAGSSTFTSNVSISSDVVAGQLLVLPNGYGTGVPLISEIVSKGVSTLTIAGKFPVSLTNTAFTVNSLREGTFGLSTTNTPAIGRIYLGEVVWVGSPTNSFTSVKNYRYLDRYVGDVKTIVLNISGNYEVSWEHQLGRYPGSFQIYYYLASDTTYSNPKVLQIGDEAVVKTNRTTITVRNRYANLIARAYDGTTQTTGSLQLIIG